MTKHNGKARRTGGERVGSALQNRNQKGGPIATSAMFRHTTDLTNVQSVLHRNDLQELMAMADLADRDFTAERTQVVVISNGAVDPLAEERDAKERRAAEDRHRHRLRLPRRPQWTPDTTPEQLDLQERTAFLNWRRELAALEEEEGLVLTPFERNLEVWRQLWRVLERSDIVVQVVDARDPLVYRCVDLEAYCREINASKASFILLNKADLLPAHVRRAWADHFDKAGLDYAFWSAYQVTQQMQQLKTEASELGVDVYELKAERKREQEEEREARRLETGEEEEEDERIRVLDGEELLELMESKARQAVEAAGPDDPRHADPNRRLVVGLVGYPNVGKSSTINALFGSKKTAVAPTPGKTKHFQTLNVSPSMCLCDCPGLVMPVFANSKSEMVAAGVIPIDRLTDIRAPVEVVAKRLGRWQLENCYGFKLPPVAPHEPPTTPPSAMQLLRCLAVLRGWTAGSGLPDESRAGRQVLRDYTSGKLVYCLLPPSEDGPKAWVPSAEDLKAGLGAAARGDDSEDSEATDDEEEGAVGPSRAGDLGDDPLATSSADIAAANVGYSRVVAHTKYTLPKFGPAVSDRPVPAPVRGAPASSSGRPGSTRAAAGQVAAPGGVALDAADLDMLQGMTDGKPRDKRPDYKFQKKLARSKGDRGQERGEGVFDGGAMVTGKKGGLVRVTGY